MQSNENPLNLLSSIFGFDKFRVGQEEIVMAAIGKEDILAIMPTGGGKSLCFQLPALMGEGLTLVVSPLIALMRDQVLQLKEFGVAAASLNSSNSDKDNSDTKQAAINGSLKLLYISPERLTHAQTIDFLTQCNVKTIAVDEAHCVSQWGHDFRPDYQQISKVRDALGSGVNKVQMLAFTATADEQTRHDIVQKLFTSNPKTFLHGFDRPNLSLAMSVKNNAKNQLLNFLSAHKHQSGIIYCQSRKKVDATAEFLKTKGLKAYPYHAGLSKEERAKNQDIFLGEDGIIIVATIAFGMGIDKPDVRFVFHMDLPKNIESYYQEIGRAGRDNLPSSTHTLYGMSEIRQYRQWIDEGNAPIEQKQIEHQKLSSLIALCEAPICRRIILLAYFGDEIEPCGNCDLCAGEVKTHDGTINAQKALSNIIRSGEVFGMEHLIAILLGEENDMSIKHGHEALSTFGIGKDISRNEWRSIYRQVYALALVEIDSNRFNRWVVTDAGWQVLRKQKTVLLRDELVVSKASLRSTKTGKNSLALQDCNTELLAALKEYRLVLAKDQKKPAFVIFSDKSLIDMAKKLPSNEEEMLAIHGVGQKKLDQYGEAFLEIIKTQK
jgi:ATP-dependent DNA helicase RecQ